MLDGRLTVIDATLVDDSFDFTLVSLSRASGADVQQLLALVHEGVLAPRAVGPADRPQIPEDPDDWTFEGPALREVRTVLRLARELDIGLAGAAVMMALLDEIELLRARLRRFGEA